MANTIDITHSEIGFTVRHMMFAKVRGQFKSWSATTNFDGADLTKAQVTVEIDAASIDTREAQRDGHLKSADFFDVEKFPKLTFTSKRVDRKSAHEFALTGDLSMHGETHEVTLAMTETGGGKDPWGNERRGFSAKGGISRAQWGLKWNQALEAGGLLVSDHVEIDVEVQVVIGK